MIKGQQRSLDFNTFLQERAQEIVKFSQILQLSTKKKGHQSLPKSIRRRAMSHNRYRIPLKLRKPMNQQLAKNQQMQKIPKCRKHIRKRNKLINSYKNRFSKIKWLSTHLWSAKRMKMIQLYGYKITQKPNDKCFRSSYRHYRHNCCLMDFSYLQWLTIKSSSEKLPQNIKITKEEQKIDLNSYHNGNIYNNQDILICPIIVIKQSKLITHCLFHPSCIEQIKQIIWQQQYQIKIINSPLDIYLLLGPQSLIITKSVLQDQGLTLKNKQWLSANPYYFNKNSIQYLYSNNNQSINKKLINSPYEQTIKQNYDKNLIKMSKNQILKLYQNMININQQKDNTQNQQFWKYYYQSINKKHQFNFQFTTRSKYTHRRGNKMTKQQKKLKKVIQKKQMEQQKEQIKIQKKIIVKEIKVTKNQQIQNQNNSSQSVMVMMVNNQKFHQGCFIICGNYNNCKIWRKLTLKNIKVIGRRQYRQCMLESNRLVFPQDYPETKSFESQQKSINQKTYKKIKNKPLQKRINYLKINSPYPFSIPTINKPTSMIQIEMVSKGKCFQGSYIAKLIKQDYLQIDKKLENGKIGIVISQLIESQEGEKNNITYNGNKDDIQSRLTQIITIRQIIGFITSGGYIFSNSKEGGIGFIYGNNIPQYVLIRKVTSRHYFLGRTRKHVSCSTY